jgi:hypothetical protein
VILLVLKVHIEGDRVVDTHVHNGCSHTALPSCPWPRVHKNVDNVDEVVPHVQTTPRSSDTIVEVVDNGFGNNPLRRNNFVLRGEEGSQCGDMNDDREDGRHHLGIRSVDWAPLHSRLKRRHHRLHGCRVDMIHIPQWNWQARHRRLLHLLDRCWLTFRKVRRCEMCWGCNLFAMEA